MIATGQWLPDITAEQYHADPCETPSLSSHCAHTIVSESPLHAWTHHPRFGGQRRERTESMGKGSLAHALFSGRHSDFQLLDFPNYRTKVAQQARDAAEALGKVPVLPHQMAEALKAKQAWDAQLERHGIALPFAMAKKEQACAWAELDDQQRAVQCRAMLDAVLLTSSPVIYDFKFVDSAHPDAVASKIMRYGYDIQETVYRSAVEHVNPDAIGRVDFLFVFLESEAPYAVQPYRLSGEYREIGRLRWERAKRTWAQCLLSGEWPGYGDDVAVAYPTSWVMSKELGVQE